MEAKENNMFYNYLEDEKVYAQLEKYWIDLFINIIGEHDKDNWIIPYYNTTFANGKKFMDANPIFSAKSKLCGKSIRVVQELPDDFEGVESWVATDGKNELVIICSISQDNIETVRAKIKSWLINLYVS